VESDFKSPGWLPYTILSVECVGKEKNYDLVSEDGEVVAGVPLSRIRGLGFVDETSLVDGSELGSRSDRMSGSGQDGDPRAHLSRAFPFLSARRLSSQGEIPGDINTNSNRLLKRTWSALGLMESLSPVGVKANSDERRISNPTVSNWICDIGGKKHQIHIADSSLERAPSLFVHVPSLVHLPAPADTTLLALLYKLYNVDEFEVFGSKPHQILYSIACSSSKDATSADQIWHVEIRSAPSDQRTETCTMNAPYARHDDAFNADKWRTENRSRKFVQPVTDCDDEHADTRLGFEGLDEICVQCLEIIELIAEVEGKMSGGTKGDDEGRSFFVNEVLSEKLSMALENPLCVVGGAVPEWCFAVATFAPHM
jgi:hypothetical protein